jgi:protein-tyrosine-phosphatase
MVAPLRVLFLCTQTFARGQMAEGWLRHLVGDHCEIHSACVEFSHIQPLAIRAIAEVGIDISGGRGPKRLSSPRTKSQTGQTLLANSKMSGKVGVPMMCDVQRG